jgi:esterase/lipase
MDSVLEHNQTFNMPRKSVQTSYTGHDVEDYLQNQQLAFANLYNILKTDKDASLQINDSTENFKQCKILDQDEKILVCVEELQKEFHHLAELLENNDAKTLDQEIAQYLEALGKKFQELTNILKTSSPEFSSNSNTSSTISHYENIALHLEDLQIHFQQLASILKIASPTNTSISRSPGCNFNDEQIITGIKDIKKRLKPSQDHNSQNQDEKIQAYLDELQKEFQQLNVLLTTETPSPDRRNE